MKSMPGTVVLAFAFVFLLSACQTTYTLVSGNKPARIGDAFTVTPTSEWNQHGNGSAQTWTLDGPLLQQILFSVNSSYGQHIIRINDGDNADDVPTFEENSSPLDLVDGMTSALKKFGFIEVTIRETGVIDLQGAETIQVHFDGTMEDLPRYRGIAYLIRQENLLHTVVYFGTELYHFEKSRAEFVTMMNELSWEAKT